MATQSAMGVNPTPNKDVRTLLAEQSVRLKEFQDSLAASRDVSRAIMQKHKDREAYVAELIGDPTYTFGGHVPLPDYETQKSVLAAAPQILPAGMVADEDVIQALVQVAQQKGLEEPEVVALFHVLDVAPAKWSMYTPFIQTKPEHLQVLQSEMKEGVQYGASRMWSLDKSDGQEVYRGLAMMVLWARGFASGQFRDGFKKTANDQNWDRGLPTVPDYMTGQYRQKFIELYPPHLETTAPGRRSRPAQARPDIATAGDPVAAIGRPVHLDTSTVIKGQVDEGDSGGTPVGAVAVVLLALGALMFLTRR